MQMPRLEILLEEPSAELLLSQIVPNVVSNHFDRVDFRIFNGKPDLLKRLPDRLRGYASYKSRPKLLVLVDEDREDCRELKAKLENAAHMAGLTTRSTAAGGGDIDVCNRIAIEELEAWILGDEDALRAAFPKLRPYSKRARYRDPDSIAGGTWEALEHLLQGAGYYSSGLAKLDCATRVGKFMGIDQNASDSFQQFVSGLATLMR